MNSESLVTGLHSVRGFYQADYEPMGRKLPGKLFLTVDNRNKEGKCALLEYVVRHANPGLSDDERSRRVQEIELLYDAHDITPSTFSGEKTILLLAPNSNWLSVEHFPDRNTQEGDSIMKNIINTANNTFVPYRIGSPKAAEDGTLYIPIWYGFDMQPQECELRKDRGVLQSLKLIIDGVPIYEQNGDLISTQDQLRLVPRQIMNLMRLLKKIIK